VLPASPGVGGGFMPCPSGRVPHAVGRQRGRMRAERAGGDPGIGSAVIPRLRRRGIAESKEPTYQSAARAQECASAVRVRWRSMPVRRHRARSAGTAPSPEQLLISSRVDII